MAATIGETWRVVTDPDALMEASVQAGRILRYLEAADHVCSRTWNVFEEALPPAVEESYRAARNALWGVKGDVSVVRERLRRLSAAGGSRG
ncbi:hypothetical protein SAMN05421805_103149 [Saccharopolyspora antimicrobica]|uniref:Uncharacterized protein n=1 Tax=Saccharopolyspora antimicrobica TaxID=455193 RepID=A0A1I4WZ62_9PSEU|nr:hypothetical protein [Saccharopolyspora antimicrobica]RKT84223.1 hypothetical protein ATL45_2533 [Saccharopolyspora antimicrobica]SFN18857.1 hypothetical protein SAMN05421805_103149 [Saccharopolyspora antimicrobica]